MTDEEAAGEDAEPADATTDDADATTDAEAAARTRPLPDPWTEVREHDYIVEK